MKNDDWIYILVGIGVIYLLYKNSNTTQSGTTAGTTNYNPSNPNAPVVPGYDPSKFITPSITAFSAPNYGPKQL
jgi:hypothetical protein